MNCKKKYWILDFFLAGRHVDIPELQPFTSEHHPVDVSSVFGPRAECPMK